MIFELQAPLNRTGKNARVKSNVVVTNTHTHPHTHHRWNRVKTEAAVHWSVQ